MNGGAAAARTAAIGAELLEMIARLNDVRLKRSSGSARKARSFQKKFKALVAQDSKAFAVIKKAHKFRAKKPNAWQAALKNGANPPLAICENCANAANLAKSEKPRTSEWLESDRREALILLRAAFESAKLNVDINLKGIRDRAFVKRAQGKIKKWRRSL